MSFLTKRTHDEKSSIAMFSDYKEFTEINLLKRRAGTAYSLKLAAGSLMFSTSSTLTHYSTLLAASFYSLLFQTGYNQLPNQSSEAEQGTFPTLPSLSLTFVSPEPPQNLEVPFSNLSFCANNLNRLQDFRSCRLVVNLWFDRSSWIP